MFCSTFSHHKQKFLCKVFSSNIIKINFSYISVTFLIERLNNLLSQLSNNQSEGN